MIYGGIGLNPPPSRPPAQPNPQEGALLGVEGTLNELKIIFEASELLKIPELTEHLIFGGIPTLATHPPPGEHPLGF